MHTYQRDFIDFCLENGVLKFGAFVLKSKRVSPYFFNAGDFKDGDVYLKLSHVYAEAILRRFRPDSYDLLFGPAYKGIILATCASMGLAQKSLKVPVSYNRKEAKDHGEGGVIIGTRLAQKKVLLVDDVITAGTTVRESVELITQAQGKLVGMVVAIDRQERGLQSNLSAVQEVEQQFHIPVVAIVTFSDLVEYIQETSDLASHLPSMLAYQKQYGVQARVSPVF